MKILGRTIFFFKQNIVFRKKGLVLQQFCNAGILPGPGQSSNATLSVMNNSDKEM